MVIRTALALSLYALALTAPASAQENATLVLKSGDKVAGQLIDMGGIGFTVRVNGQERQVPLKDVSTIDFTSGGIEPDLNGVPEGKHAIVLRNGQIVTGQLFDISGAVPLKITFKTESGTREFSSGEVAQIVLARTTGPVATTGEVELAPATGEGILVSGNRQWTPTGITVRKGQTLLFNTTGEIQLSMDASDVAVSAGSRIARYAAQAPLPRVLVGALIGRIGPNGAPFPIGNMTSVPMPATGELYLGINDDDVNDNRGEFRVEIRHTRGGALP